MPILKRPTRLLSLVCAGPLLVACLGSNPNLPASGQTSAVPPSHTMKPSASDAKHVLAQLVAGLKSEQMLKAGFFEAAALQQWFGAHQRTSTPSPLKAGVQREELVFDTAKLSLTRARDGGGFDFNLQGPAPWGLTTLSVEDLSALLGAPQKRVDIVAQQVSAASGYPQPEAGQAPISPQPIRRRGETRHPLGNQDLSWQWKSGASTVALTANINGDGTVSAVFGSQESP